MKTPSPREVMGMLGFTEYAKRGGPTMARPAATYRAARRALAKSIYRMSNRAKKDNG